MVIQSLCFIVEYSKPSISSNKKKYDKNGPVSRVLILSNLSFQLFRAVRVVNNFELIKFFRCGKKGYKPNNIPLKLVLLDKNIEVSKVD